MEDLFLHLLNLSITASYIVLAVILLRLLLFKTPKWINCLLWAVVAIRLILPFSIESILSLIPSAEPIPQDIMLSPTPQINTGIEVFNSAVNPIIEQIYTPDPATSANPLQISFAIWSCVWLIGIAAMLIWSAISYLRLRKRTAPSILLRDNVYFCDHIGFPFILGVFRPRIYLPSNLDEEETRHVIAHERAHLQRKDHLWKPIGFLLLAIYWFNPLLWLAYILLCRDIEAACEAAFVTASTLQRGFAKHVGMSPKQYLTQLRMNRALELLADNELSVKEISLACGFVDEKYFSRAFKKKYGCSPSQMRKHIVT